MQLAERWATVTTAAVEVRLALTHGLIGRLVAARRPTVSLALQRLREGGLVTSGDGRVWRLAHESQHALERVLDDLEPAPLAAVG